MDIWKEKYTEYCSSLINNKTLGAWTRAVMLFVAVTSSVFIIYQIHDELLAKKSTGNKSGVDRGYEAASLSGNNTSDATSSNSSSSSSSAGSGASSDTPPISSPSPSFAIQNPETKINQGGESNANINVSNSSGTHITNEQIIKQSVRINNEVNNLIRNNEVNKIIKENAFSAPQQPLTDLLTVKLANSSM
jgi:hypothetical protein